MSSQKNIFIVARNLLLQSVDQTVFLPANIKQGFLPPSGGNFISYVALPAKKTSVQGYNKYDSDNNLATNHILFNNPIQVDFYSDFEYSASDGARSFHQYLTAFAPEYLSANYIDNSLGIIDDIVNNTDLGDKAKYLYRYTVRYELFSHETLTIAQQFIDEVQPIPTIIL